MIFFAHVPIERLLLHLHCIAFRCVYVVLTWNPAGGSPTPMGSKMLPPTVLKQGLKLATCWLRERQASAVLSAIADAVLKDLDGGDLEIPGELEIEHDMCGEGTTFAALCVTVAPSCAELVACDHAVAARRS
jgi:hypothetical protein